MDRVCLVVQFAGQLCMGIDTSTPRNPARAWIRTLHNALERWLPVVGLEGETLFVQLHKSYRCIHPKGVVYRTAPSIEVSAV